MLAKTKMKPRWFLSIGISNAPFGLSSLWSNRITFLPLRLLIETPNQPKKNGKLLPELG